MASLLKFCYAQMWALAPILSARIGGEELVLDTIICDSSSEEESSEEESDHEVGHDHELGCDEGSEQEVG
jgi:hypothetical protein